MAASPFFLAVADKILILDDDEELAHMLAEYLGAHGFEVSHASRPAAGLEALERTSFDALVLDVMLPERDGFELLGRVRARSDIQILMLTARGDETDRIDQM